MDISDRAFAEIIDSFIEGGADLKYGTLFFSLFEKKEKNRFRFRRTSKRGAIKKQLVPNIGTHFLQKIANQQAAMATSSSSQPPETPTGPLTQNGEAPLELNDFPENENRMPQSLQTSWKPKRARSLSPSRLERTKRCKLGD